MTELHIPDEAWEAAESVAGRKPIFSTEILSIARPVLVAELRRIADKVDVPVRRNAEDAEEEAYFEGKRYAAEFIRHVVKGLGAER